MIGTDTGQSNANLLVDGSAGRRASSQADAPAEAAGADGRVGHAADRAGQADIASHRSVTPVDRAGGRDAQRATDAIADTGSDGAMMAHPRSGSAARHSGQASDRIAGGGSGWCSAPEHAADDITEAIDSAPARQAASLGRDSA